MKKQKWRGIQTTQKRKNENKPITIINRLKQKSISLPRIDDRKRWAGYPGIAGIAPRTARLIPLDLKYYVEPFAGTAKVYQEFMKLRYRVESDMKLREFTAVLNDKSKFVYNWLKNEFSYGTVITNEDFIECIKRWDTTKTIFVIDHPWYQTYYDQKFSCFDRKNIKQYDEQVLELCHKMKGNFIITTRKENKTMLNSGYYHYLVQSEYVVSGKYPKVLLTTNLQFTKKILNKIGGIESI